MAAGAFALMSGLVAAPELRAQAPATPQQPAAGQAPAAGGQPAAGGGQKNYKDKGEYDLYLKVTQTADPKARIAVLQEWQDKYPQTDYAEDRSKLFLAALAQAAQTDPAAKQQVITKASEILKADPKNFQAAYLVAVYGPQVGGQSPSPELLSQVDTAAHTVITEAPNTFDASKKPAQVTQEQFDAAKTQGLNIAYNALIWEATSKKDPAAIEAAYKEALTASPNQAKLAASYAQYLVGAKKMPEALFAYAHAAQVEGPGALPPAAKQQLMDYFNKQYTNFRGSDEGKQQMLDQAKTQALPPEGMKMESAQEMANKQAELLQKRIDTDPGFKVWYAIKQQLQEKGDAYLNSDLKDVEIPGDAVPSKAFNGTIISVDPSKVTLGVEDATKPDATLEFSQPLPAAAMEKVKVGEKIDFSGVAEAFTKEPYMLTFKDPTIAGVQLAAPAKKASRKRR